MAVQKFKADNDQIEKALQVVNKAILDDKVNAAQIIEWAASLKTTWIGPGAMSFLNELTGAQLEYEKYAAKVLALKEFLDFAKSTYSAASDNTREKIGKIRCQ